MAASLYHARKISFSTAAALASLSFDEFLFRLKEHFDTGFMIEDESVLEDLLTVKAELQLNFSATDEKYISLSADDIFKRNNHLQRP